MLQRTQIPPLPRFADTLSRNVDALRAKPETLFLTGDAGIAPSAAREALEFREAAKVFLPLAEDRTIFKLGFLWHERHADIFRETIRESLSLLGVSGCFLSNDIQGRARSFVKATGASCVSVDLLCSRFNEGASPIHVDYPEFLKMPTCSHGSPLEDRRAFAFVMPYLGEGTQYLQHSRLLVEDVFRQEIIARGTSKEGLENILHGRAEVDGCEWTSSPARRYSIHRNGLAIHRSPSSKDFRVVLAIDACVSSEALERPLRVIGERIIRNQRSITALKNGGSTFALDSESLDKTTSQKR